MSRMMNSEVWCGIAPSFTGVISVLKTCAQQRFKRSEESYESNDALRAIGEVILGIFKAVVCQCCFCWENRLNMRAGAHSSNMLEEIHLPRQMCFKSLQNSTRVRPCTQSKLQHASPCGTNVAFSLARKVRGPQKLKASDGEGGKELSPAQKMIQDRIAKAKQYKWVPARK